MDALSNEAPDSNSRCVIYSIGGNNQWKFELDLLQTTNCYIHTFDCTGAKARFDKQPSNERSYFHHVCLGTEYEKGAGDEECKDKNTKCGETWTLHQMQQKLGHNRIDLLKVDIEGWEWPLFESWPRLLNNTNQTILPKQIMVEIHYKTQFSALWPPNVHTHRKDFKSVDDLFALQRHLIQMGYA